MNMPDTEMKVLKGMVMAATIAERRGKSNIITRMIPQEGGYAEAHNPGLVGYTGDGDIFGEFAAAEFIQDFIDFSSVGDDVVPGNHLQRKQDAGVPVLLDVAIIVVVFPDDISYVADPDYLAHGGLGEYYLVGNLLLALFSRVHLDGELVAKLVD